MAPGGCSLLASRQAGGTADNTQGQPTAFGVMPCHRGEVGAGISRTYPEFLPAGELPVFENDGSYRGSLCGDEPSVHHGVGRFAVGGVAGDNGYLQVVYRPWEYYLNIPDWYFLAGGFEMCDALSGIKLVVAAGGAELIERQNMFDGTWNKTASMGQMFIAVVTVSRWWRRRRLSRCMSIWIIMRGAVAFTGYGVQALSRPAVV